MKKALAILLVLAMVLGLVACTQQAEQTVVAEPAQAPAQEATVEKPEEPKATEAPKIDYPTRDITMIVPFGAGGATDLIARSIAVGMEEKLGVSIAVTNMPGSASAVGNEYAYYDCEHDGYTIMCQPTDITSIGVMGQSDLTYKNWNFLYIAAAVPTVFCVAPDNEMNTVTDLVNSMKERKVVIATSDSGCAFTRGIGLVLDCEKDCQKPELIPSGGGANAALSCIKGDVEAVACGLPECVEYVRSGQLKPLVYFGATDITLDGADGKEVHIPCISEYYPELQPMLPFGGWVSIAVQDDTDPQIVQILSDAVEYASGRTEFTDFLASKTFVPVGLKGADANKWAEESTYVNSWLLYDMGFASKSPEEFGWARP